MPGDPGLATAVGNLRRNRLGAEADLSVVADFLHRNETSLLELKRAGLPGPVIDACFLLGHCKGSLVHERLESLRANPLARSVKIRELRALLERGDLHEAPGGRWDLARESLVRALDFLETGVHDNPFQGTECRAGRGFGEHIRDLCEEAE
jgi:hypothetical protein